MFHHVKELQFNAWITKPDPKFAALLLEQFGGANGELKAAMQYFVQAFSCRQPYPDKYDMLISGRLTRKLRWRVPRIRKRAK